MSTGGALEIGGLGLGAELEEEKGTVRRMYEYAGARALVGIEFYHRPVHELRMRRVRLDKLNPDGDSYKGTDVRANLDLVRDIFSDELTVGLATRRRGDPVTKLLEECGVNSKSFLDSELERAEGREEEYLTPNSAFGPYRGGRAKAEVGSTPLEIRDEGAHGLVGQSRTPAGRGRFFKREEGLSPVFKIGPAGIGFGGERAPMRGPPLRAAHHIPFASHVQQEGYFAGMPAIPDQQGMQLPLPIPQRSPIMQRRTYGEAQGQQEFGGAGRRRGEGREDSLKERAEMLERQRSEKRARGAITAEMRRMQASISPTEHPGLYSQMDQNAVIYDCLLTHRRIMVLTAACMASTKNVDTKFSYLADAE
jgi:hypothetical protein